MVQLAVVEHKRMVSQEAVVFIQQSFGDHY